MENIELKTHVYEMVTGQLVMGSDLVADEFAPNTYCDKLYNEVYAAMERICQRLGTAADRDLELILDRMEQINQHIALKMYDYGAFFATHS